MGNFGRPAGGFAQPKGNPRRLPLGVLDPDGARVDSQDLPGRISELKDIPGEALDGKILVDGSQEQLARLQEHPVVRIVRYRPAGSEGQEPRPAAPPDPVVDAIAVNERGATAAPRA